MRSGRDADGHPPPESIDHAASQRHEQQLGVLADKDGRLPFDQVAPQNIIGPVLIAGNERDIRRVAEIIVAPRRRQEQPSVLSVISLIACCAPNDRPPLNTLRCRHTRTRGARPDRGRCRTFAPCASDHPAAQRRGSRIKSVTTRVQAAENALASVRAEGLDPGVAEALLGRWARGELSDAQLDDAAHQISTGEPLSELGTEALALSPGSSIMTARGRPA
jgi:hypothetical protein